MGTMSYIPTYNNIRAILKRRQCYRCHDSLLRRQWRKPVMHASIVLGWVNYFMHRIISIESNNAIDVRTAFVYFHKPR